LLALALAVSSAAPDHGAVAPAPPARRAAAVGAPAAVTALPAPAEAERTACRIDRDTLEALVRFLADDLLEGRGPATRGDQLARLCSGPRAPQR
jgi:hypothetical protein